MSDMCKKSLLYATGYFHKNSYAVPLMRLWLMHYPSMRTNDWGLTASTLFHLVFPAKLAEVNP